MKKKDINKDFLTVSEFSKATGIPLKSLQHYHNKGLLISAKRGAEFENNYRLYAPPQIITAKFVRVLTDIGVPLNEIKDLAENRTPEKVLKMLSAYKDKIAYVLRYFQDVLAVIITFMDLIYEGMSITETRITVSEMPEKAIVMGDENHFTEPGVFMDEFVRFCKSTHNPGLNTSFPVGAYWPDMASFARDPVSPARFFSLDHKGNERIAAGLYLNGYSRGYYGHAHDLPERMKAFAKENGLRFTGEVYATYLLDEISVVDPEQYLMRISAAVTETRRVRDRSISRPLKTFVARADKTL